MNLTHRSLIATFLLLLFTLGIYSIYWVVVTKQEINNLGGRIPTAWLFIIPFVNIYFIYRFTQEFTKIVLHDDTQAASYFILFLFLPFIGVLFFQSKMNKVSSH